MPGLRFIGAVVALAVGLPILVLFILSWISKAPTNLGPIEGRLRPCPATPNCVCSFDHDDHAIAPLRYSGSREQAFNRLKGVLQERPRCIVRGERKEPAYLYAEESTALFRFVDDLEFLFDPAEPLIHVRSASRIGRSDLGVNRERVEAIRRSFEAKGESNS